MTSSCPSIQKHAIDSATFHHAAMNCQASGAAHEQAHERHNVSSRPCGGKPRFVVDCHISHLPEFCYGVPPVDSLTQALLTDAACLNTLYDLTLPKQSSQFRIGSSLHSLRSSSNHRSYGELCTHSVKITSFRNQHKYSGRFLTMTIP
jgi:hypothetical protein